MKALKYSEDLIPDEMKLSLRTALRFLKGNLEQACEHWAQLHRGVFDSSMVMIVQMDAEWM